MSGNGWKAFTLRPDDLLFFRDGKPSTQGADHYLRSLFPPYPSTLYGALRTRRLMDAGIDLEGLNEATWAERLGDLRAELGEWAGFGSLELRGPWFVQEGVGALLPAPLDLGVCLAETPATTRDDATDDREPGVPAVAEVVRYRLETRRGAGAWSHALGLWSPYRMEGSDWSLWKHQPGASDPRPAAEWLLTSEGLHRWAHGGVPAPGHFVHRNRLWTDEVRTGVGLQAGRRYTEESLLYTFGLVRLCEGVSLAFEARGTFLEPGGHLRLGGEGRTAALASGSAFPIAAPPPGETFSLSFVTPAVSRAGAYPPGFESGVTEGTLAGKPARLLGAVVPGFVRIGGWDMARRQPKPLRCAIPPGATYVVQGLGGDGGGAGEVFGKNLSDYDDEALARQGFGLAVAGIYQ